jgi:hypothetical protein
VALFRRPKDDGGDAEWVPTDDMADFACSERQRLIRKNKDTVKRMEKLWAEIQERWRNPWRQP